MKPNKDLIRDCGIPVRVDGIPALAWVTHYRPNEPGTIGPVDSYATIAAPVAEEVEYDLYDRRGYRAAWLEEKMLHRKTEEGVTQQVLRGLKEDRDAAI